MYNRYFEDMKPGDGFETMGKTLSEAEILDFAFRYDPQPFHMDAAYAAASPYGGLIASGIHTQALAVRLMIQTRVFAPEIFLGSPGIDELRWLHPVRPGDTLRARGEVLEARTSRSAPEQGILRYRLDLLNQRDEVVMTMVSAAILRRGPPAPDGDTSS